MHYNVKPYLMYISMDCSSCLGHDFYCIYEYIFIHVLYLNSRKSDIPNLYIMLTPITTGIMKTINHDDKIERI